jgi:hypothetical protein
MFDTQNTGRFYYECDNDFVCGNWSNPGEDCGIRDCYCWCIAELGCGGNGTETKACPQAPPPPADGDSDSDSDGDGDWGRITCEENWTCTNWLPCFNGIQTRTCTDQNNCSTNQSRPALMQTCSSTIGGEENQSLNQSYNPEENITTDEETSFEETPGTVNIILLLNNNTTKTAGIIVIIGLVSLMIYSSIKKKRQELNNKFSKLDQYIKECLGQNKSSEFIAQKLKSVGWPEEFVKNRIKEVGKNENLQTR